MRNLWHDMAPFASDTTGACVVFERQRALVIAQDSNGSVSVLRRVMDVSRSRASYETVDLPEISYTLGRERDFQDRMAELVEETAEDARRGGDEGYPDFAVLVDGPVANLLGVDLEGRALLLSEREDLPVVTVETTGNRYYDKGIEAAYEAIYRHFVNPAGRSGDGPAASPRTAPGSVNFLGLTELDWPGRAYLRHVARWLNAGDRRVIADFGFGDSPDAWALAPTAEENLVFSVAGIGLARRMESDFGIPWTPVCDVDWFDEMAEGLSLGCSPRVLVVGEQVTSNLLRRLLGKMGAGAVDVATFYVLDKGLAREGDMRLRGESDLKRALSTGGGYDFAVCDASLAGCAKIPVFGLMHPPTGFGSRDNTELSREWLSMLANVIRGLSPSNNEEER